jgi:hypothetical protein
LPDFSWYNIPKLENCTERPQNIPTGDKIYTMAIKYTNTPIYKALLSIPDLGFWYENITSGNPDEFYLRFVHFYDRVSDFSIHHLFGRHGRIAVETDRD